jgi:hypothetical protein
MIALSGAAFAQSANDGADANFTVVDDNTNVQSGDSLLRQVLNRAGDVQVSMTNAAENLANLDGSINVLESANVDELLRELTADVSFGDGGGALYTWELNGTVDQGTLADFQAAVNSISNDVSLTSVAVGPDGNLGTADDVYTYTVDGGAPLTGNLAQYNAAVAASGNNDDVVLYSVVQDDTFAGLLKGVSRTVDGTTAIDFFDPALTVDALQTSVSNLTTTVIGALNTGVIGQGDATGNIAANTLAMANMQLESVAQTTGSLANSAQYFQPGDLQLTNLATNMATVVDASVNVDQLMANVDTVSTTLIGALNTGDIAADVNQNASNLTQALVGQ